MSNYIKKASSFIKKDVRFSDVSIGFGINPFNKDVTRVTEVDSVKRSVKSLILTDRYERLLDPQIGGNVKKFLFEPISSLTSTVLEDYIKDVIKNYEPRAFVERIIVEPDYDRNSYQVSITFTMNSVEQPQTLDILLERVR